MPCQSVFNIIIYLQLDNKIMCKEKGGSRMLSWKIATIGLLLLVVLIPPVMGDDDNSVYQPVVSHVTTLADLLDAQGRGDLKPYASEMSTFVSANAFIQSGQYGNLLPTDIVFIGQSQITALKTGQSNTYLQLNQNDAFLTITSAANDKIALVTCDLKWSSDRITEAPKTVLLVQAVSTDTGNPLEIYGGGYAITGVVGNHRAIAFEEPSQYSGARSHVYDFTVNGEFCPKSGETVVDISDKATNIHVDVSGISCSEKTADTSLTIIKSMRAQDGISITGNLFISIRDLNVELIHSNGDVSNSEITCDNVRVDYGNLTLINAMRVKNVKLEGTYQNDPHTFYGIRSTENIESVTADVHIVWFNNVYLATSYLGSIRNISVSGSISAANKIVAFTYGRDISDCFDNAIHSPYVTYTFSKKSNE